MTTPDIAKKTRGFALVSVALLLGLVMAFGVVLLDYVFSGRTAGRQLQQTETALQIAEAGVNKAIFCLNATSAANCGTTYGSNYAGQANISFGSGTFTTTVSGSGTNRTITATGIAPGNRKATIKTDATTIPSTTSMSFSYAMQSGAGGAHLENNSTISGTIYSSGNIDCKSTNAIINGDAYSSNVGGSISGCWVKFDAHADQVLNDKVSHNAYFRNSPADIAGSTVTGTKYPNSATPTTAALPTLDLDFWRNAAVAGGTIVGDYSPANNSNLGPVKITGNLNMNNNVNVTVKGPVWVMGNISAGNNVSYTLDPAFGPYSTAILADDPNDMTNHGMINISNNTGIFGSGDTKSHIMFISTNNSTNDALPALQVSNNASGAVFYAPNGTLRISNNGGAKSLAGYRLYLDENSSVTYVASDFSGFFSNSPGGRWRILEGTWREIK